MSKEQLESEREMVCHMASRILAGLVAADPSGDFTLTDPNPINGEQQINQKVITMSVIAAFYIVDEVEGVQA